MVTRSRQRHLSSLSGSRCSEIGSCSWSLTSPPRSIAPQLSANRQKSEFGSTSTKSSPSTPPDPATPPDTETRALKPPSRDAPLEAAAAAAFRAHRGTRTCSCSEREGREGCGGGLPAAGGKGEPPRREKVSDTFAGVPVGTSPVAWREAWRAGDVEGSGEK